MTNEIQKPIPLARRVPKPIDAITLDDDGNFAPCTIIYALPSRRSADASQLLEQPVVVTNTRHHAVLQRYHERMATLSDLERTVFVHYLSLNGDRVAVARAARLNVKDQRRAVKQVGNHLDRIRTKLHAASTIDLVCIAVCLGIIPVVQR